jgi:segregation and condensation protein B
MTDNIKNRVKEIASEIAENPDEIKFIKAGSSLVIPETLSSDPGSISSGLEKGREDEGDGTGSGAIRTVPDTRQYDREGEGEGEGEGDREIDLPDDEDNPAKKKKESKEGEGEGDEGDEGEGDEGDEGDEEGEGDEGDEEDGDKEGKKGKSKKGKKKKAKKGKKGPSGDDDEGDGDDEDEGDEEEDEDDDQEQKPGPPKQRRLKQGDKVIIKPKMVVGKVIKVNTDGTYQVEETGESINDLNQGLLKDGGQLSESMESESGVPVEVMANGAVVDDVADINVVAPSPGTVGDYEEEELEYVGKPQKPPKNPPTTPPPPPPPPKPVQLPDYNQLLEKIEQLKVSKFKFPAIGKFLFGSELNAESMFYKYQAPLALNNRLARVVFNKKRFMPDSDANKYKNFVISYPNYLNFCINCLEYQIDGFYLPADKPFTPAMDLDASMLSSRFSGPKGLVDIINSEMMKAAKELEPLSLNQIQEMLETAMQRGDKPYNLPIGRVNRGIVAQIYLDFIENELVKDYQFYRILSLSAFIKPEYFDDRWLNAHCDYIFNYFRNNELGFSNLPGVAFSPNRIDNDVLYGMMKRNLNIYNVIRANTTDEYKVYVFENMKTIDPSLPDSRVKFSIKTINELSNGGKITDDLCRELTNFYQFSTTLRIDYANKESVLFNLQKLANLQKESYETLLRDIDLQIKIYGV